MRDSRPAQNVAREELKGMGPLSRKELIMAGTSGLTVLLWIASSLTGPISKMHSIWSKKAIWPFQATCQKPLSN